MRRESRGVSPSTARSSETKRVRLVRATYTFGQSSSSSSLLVTTSGRRLISTSSNSYILGSRGTTLVPRSSCRARKSSTQSPNFSRMIPGSSRCRCLAAPSFMLLCNMMRRSGYSYIAGRIGGEQLVRRETSRGAHRSSRKMGSEPGQCPDPLSRSSTRNDRKRLGSSLLLVKRGQQGDVHLGDGVALGFGHARPLGRELARG